MLHQVDDTKANEEALKYPDDFMERITEIFMYQMEKKQSKRLLWKIVHKLLNKMVYEKIGIS